VGFINPSRFPILRHPPTRPRGIRITHQEKAPLRLAELRRPRPQHPASIRGRSLLANTLAPIAVAVALLSPTRSPAADCGGGLNHFQHTAWTLAEGAPPDIWALAQSADGYLWLGTGAGLYRFDGVRFEPVRPTQGPSFPAIDITALLFDKTGGLWIGYQSGGVSVLRDGQLTNYINGLPRSSIHQFAQDQDGRIWLTSDGGMAEFSGGEWHDIDRRWSSPPAAGNSLFVARDGTLWVTTSWGKSFRQDGSQLVYLQRGSNRFQDSGEYIPVGAAITQAPDGRLWVSDPDRGARQLPEFPLLRNPPARKDELSTAWNFRALALQFDNEGALWGVDRAAGIFRLQMQPRCFGGHSAADPPPPERLSAQEGLTSAIVGSLLKDTEGNLWVGTNLGLDRFRSANVVLETAIPTLSPEGYRGARGESGEFYVSSGRSLYRVYANGESEKVFNADGPITFLSTGRDGTIWSGTPGGLFQLTHNHSQKVDLPQTARAGSVWKFEQDASGRLWVALWGEGIFLRTGSTWQRFEVGPKLSDTAPALMTTDAENRKWLYYQGGPLVLVDGNEVRTFTEAEAPHIGNIQTILPTPREVLLAGDMGLARFIGGRFQILAVSDHPQLARISGIVQTAQGETWLNGITGLVRMQTRDLEAAFNEPARPFGYQLLDFRDGLPGPALQDSREPTAAEGSDGRLWFITNHGVAWVDPTRLTRNLIPPPVLIRSVRANGIEYPASARVTLPKGTSDVEIDYTALSLSIPERVHFQYRLEGSDAEWIDPAARRQAFYTRLGPGDYRFQVRAANNDGVWNMEGASMQLTIPPTFVQSRLFRMLCGLAAVLLLWLLYSLRLRQISTRLSDRSEARLAERERIARELHDTLLQGFQGLILRFQSVANRLPPGTQGRELINEVLERADDVIIEGRDRVRSLRAVSSEAQLADIFNAAAERLHLTPAIDFRLMVEGTAKDLDSSVVEELAQMGNEALFNSLRHARCSNIEVRIVYAARNLRVSFSDDGVGIDPAVLANGRREDHFGLTGMRERAKRINAGFALRSAPDTGTTIEVTVPARVAYSTNRKRRSGFTLTRALIKED
jgi:signal transduction histidine kinase/ligand-binding sensor domain-containing protein